LITADAGGSNGYRTRTWKTELARFAAEAGLAITVCHLPPGTSKWNRINALTHFGPTGSAANARMVESQAARSSTC
jgi:hypothetical protein